MKGEGGYNVYSRCEGWLEKILLDIKRNCVMFGLWIVRRVVMKDDVGVSSV